MSGRPPVFLYTNRPAPDCLREICAGIEEEGVPFQVMEREEADLDTLAWEAASESMLGSGIGIRGREAAMQMRSVPKGHNVFEVRPDSDKEEASVRHAYDAGTDRAEKDRLPGRWRILGANSARAVKKLPFKE